MHAKLPQGIEDVNVALNSLMDLVEATLAEAQDFRDQFFVQLFNKGKFYD